MMQYFILFAAAAFWGTGAASALPAVSALNASLPGTEMALISVTVPDARPTTVPSALPGAVLSKIEPSLAEMTAALNGRLDRLLLCLQNYITAQAGEDGVWAAEFNQAYDGFFVSVEALKEEALAQNIAGAQELSSRAMVVCAAARGAIKAADAYAVALATGSEDAAYKKKQMEANAAMAHQMINGLAVPVMKPLK